MTIEGHYSGRILIIATWTTVSRSLPKQGSGRNQSYSPQLNWSGMRAMTTAPGGLERRIHSEIHTLGRMTSLLKKPRRILSDYDQQSEERNLSMLRDPWISSLAIFLSSSWYSGAAQLSTLCVYLSLVYIIHDQALIRHGLYVLVILLLTLCDNKKQCCNSGWNPGPVGSRGPSTALNLRQCQNSKRFLHRTKGSGTMH